MLLKYFVSIVLLVFTAGSVAADEINIYSYRQPFLIQPLTDAFTEETGVKVNVAYLRKGMIEKMTATDPAVKIKRIIETKYFNTLRTPFFSNDNTVIIFDNSCQPNS